VAVTTAKSLLTSVAVISLKSQERTKELFANSDSWYPTTWVWLSAFKLKNCGYSIGELERRWSATSRMEIFAGNDSTSTPFAPPRKRVANPTENYQFKRDAGFWKEIWTFSADFTTAHEEGTDRNGAMWMYSGGRDKWVGEIRVEWKGR